MLIPHTDDSVRISSSFDIYCFKPKINIVFVKLNID